MKITFLDNNDTDHREYTFAIMIAQHHGQWVMVRHRDRSTWELPAGHIEKGESPDEAARRELFEETGARDYSIRRLCAYEGTYNGRIVYGVLFYTDIQSFDPIPESEIAEKKLFPTIPADLTYPDIQPQFIEYYLNT